MADFSKDFDDLLDGILTDYRNQFPEVDTSQGSLVFIKAACTASALWGLYRYQDYIAEQIFPDSADSAHLEHHAWVRGLERKTGETDAELLARLLKYIRRPPAGGNRYDYVKWALEVDGVAAAWCIPLGQGLGTVDVIIQASGDDEIPDEDLLNLVRAYIDDVRPVTASVLRVLAPEVVTRDVALTVSGDDLDTDAIADAVTAYISALEPGEGLYQSQLLSIAVRAGADDAAVSDPAANVTATAYQLIRPGVVGVTAV